MAWSRAGRAAAGLAPRGCAVGQEALRAAGSCRCPHQCSACPWGAEALLGVPHGPSLFTHSGRYLRLRPRGFLLPLPGGPALAAAAAPLLQHQPAPTAPGRLPLAPWPPPPALFSFNFHLHARPRLGGAGATPPPPPRGPPRCRPAVPAGRSQRRAGVRAGAPRQSGDRQGAPASRPPGHSDLEKWRRCPPPATPPSTSPIFLA